MPRRARREEHPLLFLPNTTYHITARGCDRIPIFHSDTDRRLFLACTAEACLFFGVTCHAFCLMTNHFHLVIEDTPGVLSQFMHRVLSTYVGLFNRSRPAGRCGPLFQDRFHSEVLDSERYFRAACAYTVLNPLRCSTPLADTPEAYTWSSAAFAVAPAERSAAEFCAGLLEGCGGTDGFIKQLTKARRKSSRDMQRRRAEALVSGIWLSRSRLLAGRSPNEYRSSLMRARGLPKPTSENTSEDGAWHFYESVDQHRSTSTVERIAFAGAEIELSLEAAREVCGRVIPGATGLAVPSGIEPASVTQYVLWRFTTVSIQAIANAVGATVEVVRVAIEQLERVRAAESGWRDLLWRVEWALRWRLRSGPCRC